MRRSALLSIVVLPGCQSTLARCAALSDTPPAVQLGAASETWAPLQEDGVLPIDFGPQGGWHTYGSLRTAGLYGGTGRFDGTSPTLSFTLNAEDGTFTGGYRDIARPLREHTDATYTLLRDPLMLHVADSSEADGARVHLQTTVSDVCGRSASAQRTVLLSLRE